MELRGYMGRPSSYSDRGSRKLNIAWKGINHFLCGWLVYHGSSRASHDHDQDKDLFVREWKMKSLLLRISWRGHGIDLGICTGLLHGFYTLSHSMLNFDFRQSTYRIGLGAGSQATEVRSTCGELIWLYYIPFYAGKKIRYPPWIRSIRELIRKKWSNKQWKKADLLVCLPSSWFLRLHSWGDALRDLNHSLFILLGQPPEGRRQPRSCILISILFQNFYPCPCSHLVCRIDWGCI